MKKPVLLAAAGLLLSTQAVRAQLSIENDAAVRCMVGRQHLLELTTVGGTSPFLWTVAGARPLPPGLALNPDTGVIRGVPLQAGTFVVGISVFDSRQQFATKEFTFTVAESLEISTPSPLQSGAVGVRYEVTLSGKGGTRPYTWGMVSYPAVAGLTLHRDGVWSGTPTLAGNYSVEVQLQDAYFYLASKVLSLTIVAAPLVISTASQLPPGAVGDAYSAKLAASGGAPPYTWSLRSGSLPAGLALNSGSGEIAGAPTAAGTSTFAVAVRDSTATEVTKGFTVAIAERLTIATECPLPQGTVGTAYSTTLALTGGRPSYAWSIQSGSLPGGLVLAGSTGVISGMPTTAGTASFTLRVRDGQGREATKPCAVPIALSITPATLPDGVVGRLYTQVLRAAGGSGSYAWAIVAGTLPPGLTLNSSTGEIRGTPTGLGDYKFTLRASDLSRQAAGDKALGLMIDLAPMPAVTIGGLPSTLTPRQQPRVTLSLASGYPLDLTGQLEVRFSSEAAIAGDDQELRFASGSRAATFRIPANSQNAVFASGPEMDLQIGAVAGTVSIVASLYVENRNVTPASVPTRSGRISPQPPVITEDVAVDPAPDGFRIRIIGYSTTRQILDATFTFSAGAGYTISSATHTVSTAAASDAYFRTSPGGTFIYEQPFRIDNAGGLRSVAVTLRNSSGPSQSKTRTIP